MLGRDGTPPPKYINSPESTVYKKGPAPVRPGSGPREPRRQERALLVEGNFDVISLHQAGITEAVAPLGTALTPEQVDALRRLTDEVVLCYDGDRAGKSATRGALELLVAADVPVRVIALPDGDDPDALVQRDGAAALGSRIDGAQGGIEYYCFEAQWGLAQHRRRPRPHPRRGGPLRGQVANPTKRELLVGTLATAMGVEREVVTRALARARAGDGRGRGDGRPGPSPGPAPEPRAAAPGPATPRPGPTRWSSSRSSPTTGIAGNRRRRQGFSHLTDSRLRAICSAARAGQTFLEPRARPPLKPPPPSSCPPLRRRNQGR
ncbi:MAG: toprim domain-containing protein [Kofleriaceae bacterium]